MKTKSEIKQEQERRAIEDMLNVTCKKTGLSSREASKLLLDYTHSEIRAGVRHENWLFEPANLFP